MIEGHVDGRDARSVDARAVDEQRRRAQLAFAGVEQGVDVLFTADIDLPDDHLLTERLQFAQHLFAFGDVAVRSERDFGTGPSQRHYGRASNPRTAARDHCHLVGQARQLHSG